MAVAPRIAPWTRRFGGRLGVLGSGPLGGVTPTLTATWDPTLSRVLLVATGLYPTTASVIVDRYDTPILTNPDTIRGGERDAVPGQALTWDDREFTPGVANTYRLRAYDAAGSLLGTAFSSAVTPVLAGIWLRSPARPFLDRTVTVVGFSEVTSPARGGVLEVVGRRDPVAVTEKRGSRRYVLTLRADDAEEAAALELFLSFGDVVLLLVPDGCVVPRSMYAFVGDTTFAVAGRHDSAARYVTLPLTQVAAPDSAIVGYSATNAGILAVFTTCAEILATFATCADLLAYVSDPADEVTG